MAIAKVVVKYLDGRMIKGTTLDFVPNSDAFHIDVTWTNEEKKKLGMRELVLSKLKAIFFVRSFAGRKAFLEYGKEEHKEREEFLPQDETRGKKIAIEFFDGEKLNALSLGFGYERKGFFVHPVDPDSNNERIFVVWSTVKNIKEIISPGRKGEAIGSSAINVVVKYLDGKMIKGSTLNFSPDRDFFHLNVIQTGEQEQKEEELGIREVKISTLKAIFFVESLTGKPTYKEREKLSGNEGRGRKINIEFHDGEKMSVTSMGFRREKKGFFVNPLDSKSNNIRIFVVASTVKKIEEMPFECRDSSQWLAVNKVVVKYLDGRILKGSTFDLDPEKDTFHLDIIEEDGHIDLRLIDIRNLKAIFFVKDFAGKPDYEERNEFLPQDEKRGKKIRIEFSDGEKLNALSLEFKRVKKGFFVHPIDPDSNNERIFVISDTVKNIEEI